MKKKIFAIVVIVFSVLIMSFFIGTGFIMKILSPDYKKYHDALTSMNQRICSELGLYYDADYNLVRKKENC